MIYRNLYENTDPEFKAISPELCSSDEIALNSELKKTSLI